MFVKLLEEDFNCRLYWVDIQVMVYQVVSHVPGGMPDGAESATLRGLEPMDGIFCSVAAYRLPENIK